MKKIAMYRGLNGNVTCNILVDIAERYVNNCRDSASYFVKNIVVHIYCVYQYLDLVICNYRRILESFNCTSRCVKQF